MSALLSKPPCRRYPACWHRVDKGYCQRLRLKLEATLGGECSFCGLTRDDGVDLQFHHHLGRDWKPRKLSWKQRLLRYRKEIRAGVLKYLACELCHEAQRGKMPRNEVTKLYEYDGENVPF